MCTSFISRKNDAIIAMNFDNNGMKFSMNTSHAGWFVVDVDGGRGKYPSFGVDRDGRFFNNLLVNSNGKGLYRRPSTRVTHTSKLVSDILNGILAPEQLKDYLDRVEVVNTPDWSCHNMICDSAANVWIIEPGRGNIYSSANESPFYVMTNSSLVDLQNGQSEYTCNRHTLVSERLAGIGEMNVQKAFEILEAASQTEGEWTTAFSMVFSKAERTVYFCHQHDFTQVNEYHF